MKVATKLSGAFGLLVILLVGLLVYHVRTTRGVVRTSYHLSEISGRLNFSATNQSVQLGHIEETAVKYRITRDSAYLRQFRDAVGGFDAGLRTLAAEPLTAEERAEVDRLVALWGEFVALAEEYGAALRPDRDLDARLLQIQTSIDGLREQTQRVAAASREVMERRLAESASAARKAERVTWGAAAVALTVSILVSGLIIRSVADALARLQEGTRQVAEGNFDYRLDLGRKDEFAQLAHDFNVMNHRLGELDRMKRDFLSKVSHDLKTPLASMQETIQLLLDGVPGPLTESQRRLLELNQESARRLSAMIGKILQLSAMEAGTVGLEIGTYDLAALVREAIDHTTMAGADRGVRITADLPEATLFVDCDRDQILQVLLNLLENATKFTPAGGEVRVSVRYAKDRPADVPEERWLAVRRGAGRAAGVACIEVTDDGPGVPDDDKEMIFERFYQTQAGRKVAGRGVGLGLTICREIVDAHGGEIWVQDAPDGGATFVVLLPGATVRAPRIAAVGA
ncbi:MAG: ATP-binding protein [Gemmatimonadota bacterium]